MSSKVIGINADYLGAIKQLPPFLRELTKLDKNYKIYLRVRDSRTGESVRDTLERDLDFERICYGPGERIEIGSAKNREDLEIDFGIGKTEIWNKLLRFHIDPLKFEKRRLLNEEERNRLKENYSFDERKIIVAGSFSLTELGLLSDSLNQGRKIKNLQIVIVPRVANYGISKEIKYASRESTEKNNGEPITIVNQKGCLFDLYSLCDVALIGSSFNRDASGQNPLEPAFYGKRIYSGSPQENWNNLVAYRGLMESGLLKVIKPKNIGEVLRKRESPKKIAMSNREAQEFIKSYQGAARDYALAVYQKLEEGRIEESLEHRILNYFSTKDCVRLTE